jgi:hypothetical protein
MNYLNSEEQLKRLNNRLLVYDVEDNMRRWLMYGIIIMVFVILFEPVSLMAQRNDLRQKWQNKQQIDVLYLTPAEEKEVLDYLRQFYPEGISELKTLKINRPQVYRRALSRAFREMRFLQDLKTRDPAKHKQMILEKQLESEGRVIAKKYRKSRDEEEKTRLKDKLRALLERSFDLRQLNRQMEIDRLEAKLQDLKEQNRRRIENKQDIVENRLNDMIGESSQLEW